MKRIKISIGGILKEELISLLKEKNILINPLGEKLLESDLFHVTRERQQIDLTEISLIELGLTDGKAGLLEVIRQAQNVGLNICSPDVAPFLRLAYFDDKNSHGTEKKHKTPDGAVTVVSEILDEDVHFPKGFYLRKIDNNYWLRGYICDYEHTFEPNERFIFMGTFNENH